MANGPALSTAKGGQVYVGSTFIDSLSLLDVLRANQFEGESFDPQLTEQTEEHFYRGAPPCWLNFHISEQVGGSGTSIIKRDGYEKLKQEIQKKRELPGISTVKLFHQSGCGGTTLAMQVLWDLRKTFRCAVLTGPTSDTESVAKQVVSLFTAGSKNHQNTVLLLVEEDQKLENLSDGVLEEIANQKIVTHMPALILVKCIRKSDNGIQQMEEPFLTKEQKYVIVKKALSQRELKEFNQKKEELLRRYGDKCQHFHGFNILQTNFSQNYVQKACEIFRKIKKSKRPLKNQLVAFLSLLNTYVPGSYLLESQCLKFLRDEDNTWRNLEKKLKPFSPFIITFQQNNTHEKKVRMVHPMIAKCCTELMDDAGVTRSDTARNLLRLFCEDEVPPCLLSFIKDMLTKRGERESPKNNTEVEEEKFSRLILDIQNRESGAQSASVLKVASKKFHDNPFFPQALARFFYIELNKYSQAEMWAKRAKKRDPKNSFVADTLGQVYKNHLNKTKDQNPREILKLAKKAILAFKHEEELAGNEQDQNMKDDGLVKVSSIFNCRGKFGYLQVCNTLYDKLVQQNEKWEEVLTKKVPMCSALESLGDNKLYRFDGLIKTLRDEVEKKCDFFDKYLNYSKPTNKDDPAYLSESISQCYRRYVGYPPTEHPKPTRAELIQKLREKQADTSVGILCSFVRGHTESELEEITAWCEKICSRNDSISDLVNYILAHIMLLNTGTMRPIKEKHLTKFKQKMPLTPKGASELHMLALLMFWPEDTEATHVFDLSQLIQQMRSAYEQVYKMQFRSRYLRPLFFLGKGQHLNRMIHRVALEQRFPPQSDDTTPDWQKENMFKNPGIQNQLLKLNGVVRNYRVYTTVGGKEIEVEANLKNSIWKQRPVSFYLGFTIRGPVAFAIQTRNTETEFHGTW